MGPFPSTTPPALEHDVAEPGRTHILPRPIVELVEERARLRRGTGCRDGAHDAAGLDHTLEGVERDARLIELVGHVGDDERDCAGPACRCRI